MSDNPKHPNIAWALGTEAERWLDEASDTGLPLHRLAKRLRGGLGDGQARQVMELADLRRRGERKFTRARRMFFSRLGLEQATDEWIARYKAARFAGRTTLDLCCGIGGDAIGLAGVATDLTLVDRSPLLIEFAERNLLAYHEPGCCEPRYLLADAADAPVEKVQAWHIDPDRRPSGGRTTTAALHEPADTAIDRLMQRNSNAAIKLAPACDVPARWADAGELEWISRDGECKQQVVWLGELTAEYGRRRASVVRTHAGDWTIERTLLGTPASVPYDEEVGPYVYEPDAAILASNLVGALAAEHGWWAFSSTVGYLAGRFPVNDAATNAFEVLDVLPLHVKKLARHLRERKIGRIEIKHRVIDLSPEQLRRDLKPQGENAATLLLTRVGERRIAIVARRFESITT